jgi:hypothetical protein
MLPSLTSTDKSVCATPALPVAALREHGWIVWHRHSCLCFGKVQCLILLSQAFKRQVGVVCDWASGIAAADSRVTATGASTASSIGRICESCLMRMTRSQAGSNFFHPAL